MSNINTNATVTLTVNGKQAQDMLDGLRKKSQDLEQAIDKARKAGDKASLQKLQRELKQTKSQINQIESATVGVERVMKNLDKATPKELQKTLTTLKKQLNGIERGTAEWNRQTEAIRRVKAELDKVNLEMREAEGRWSRFNRIVNDWQTTIMGAAAAVTGFVMAGRAAVRAYADMDAELANVRKFTGMTAEQVAQLNEEFKKMDTRTSREDLNKLAQEAGRLGKTSIEDVLGFVKAADQINVALDDLGEGATLTLSKLTNIFGDEKRLGTEKALLAVGSVINELSQNCTASAPYLANFAQRLAGVGAQAKMTIPEIMGFAAVLDSQGQAVEMSATALQKLIMDMFSNTDKIIKATGMNAKAFKDILAKDANEALIMLLERLRELGNIDVLAPVFKDMGENGARASSVIAALAGNIETVKWEQEEANKAFKEATSVTGEFNVQNTTVQAGLDKAKKSFNEMAVQLGERLVPVMSHVISSTSMLMKAMLETINFISKYKAEIVGAAAVLAAYAVAVNLVAIKTKIATVATAAWNAVIKTCNVLLPLARVAMDGLKLAFERVVWQTRGATAAAQQYNRSLMALKASAASLKVAYGLLAVAIGVAVVALIRWIRAQDQQAKVAREVNKIKSEAIKNANDEIAKIEQLVKVAESENLSMKTRESAVRRLNKLIPEYNAQLDKTTGKYKANKDALDRYIESLIRQYEVQGAREELKDISRQKVKLMQERAGEEANLKEAQENRGGRRTQAIVPGAISQQPQGLAEVNYYHGKIEKIDKKMDTLHKTEAAITKMWGEDLFKEASPAKEPEPDIPTSGGSVPSSSSSTNKNTGNSTKSHEDKFAAEKAWKEKEEALNRIAYATGKEDYEQYQKRMLEITEQYNQKILERNDLTEQEKLNAQVGYYEAQQKAREESLKRTIEDENNAYNEQVAAIKQKFVDGKMSTESYERALELLELAHMREMVSITKEGTKERLQAEKEYQDKLIADMKKKQQEAEQAEKEHQQRLKSMKDQYFGDSPEEKQIKYLSDLNDLDEVYNMEIAMAGENAQEKLRIEEAYQKAKKDLRQKYNIESAEDEKGWLEQMNEDVMSWINDPEKGELLTRTLAVVSEAMGAVFQQLTSLVQAETDIQIASIEKRYAAEISQAEGNNYKVKQLEKKKEKEIAKIKNEANKKMFAMQVIQAVAQTATSAINAYSSAAVVPYVGYILAPIAAASAIAAGMLQVAAIKKQQQAAEAQGYAEGGFTGKGKKYEVAGVVHKGEWVASQELVNSPVARPMIDALEYAQRNNTIGSLRTEDVARSINPFSLGSGSAAAATPTVIVQQASPSSEESGELAAAFREYAATLSRLQQRLDEPFVTVNTVTGDKGIKQAQDDYDQLIRNKTPKSRRK